jgi:hypothetical protein
MKLLTNELRRVLPALYSTENDKDPMALVKFFTPWTSWSWYATEFDGEDTFFGLVDGLERELGYFSLLELESITGPGGLRIERDLYFEPTPLSRLGSPVHPREQSFAPGFGRAPTPSSSLDTHATPPSSPAITLSRPYHASATMPDPTQRDRAAGARPTTPTTNQTTEHWSDGLQPPERELTREERVRETANKALDSLAEALEQGRSEALTEYLGAMSRFHRYSFHNVMLIAMQRPDATFVAGFRTWQHEFGRYVMKGEKGIAILAPMVRKAKASELAEDGGEVESNARVLRGFRVVHVFDVSQTDGKPLPEFARVRGDPGENLDRLKALVARHGIELSYEPHLEGGALGESSGGKIAVLAGQAPAEEFSVLAHEMAHELLHKVTAEEKPDKSTRETEAEAVAFVVCSAAGLETGTAARDYIQLYRGDKETLGRSLERIQKTAATILEAVLPGAQDRSS